MFDTVVRCKLEGCQSKTLNRMLVGVIGYSCSAVALSIPFLNATGSSLRSVAEISALNMSWGAIFILIVWFVSGVVAVSQRHEHAIACVLHSLGLPGLFLAILTFLK